MFWVEESPPIQVSTIILSGTEVVHLQSNNKWLTCNMLWGNYPHFLLWKGRQKWRSKWMATVADWVHDGPPWVVAIKRSPLRTANQKSRRQSMHVPGHTLNIYIYIWPTQMPAATIRQKVARQMANSGIGSGRTDERRTHGSLKWSSGRRNEYRPISEAGWGIAKGTSKIVLCIVLGPTDDQQEGSGMKKRESTISIPWKSICCIKTK